MKLLKGVKVLYKDKLTFWLVNFSILFIAATLVEILVNKIEPSIIAVLHYNIYAGIDIIGNYKWLYWLPIIFWCLSIINFVLAIWLWTKEQMYSYFLLILNILMNLVVFLYIYNILIYNS